MTNSNIQNPKLLFAAVFIILFTTITGLYLYKGVLQSADEIIEDNKNITRTAVAKLGLEAERSLPPVWEEHLKGKDRIIKADERIADSLLSVHVQEVLSNFYRVEGGFYFYELDEFIGYSFPTIDEPKPAFGPPPRSYNIIRRQVRTTFETDSILTQLHQFDPAIFPLTTQPIYLDGERIGTAWARIHIERKLATSQSIQSGTFFLTVGAVLLGLTIAILIVWNLRKGMSEIKKGLNRMKHDPSHRLTEHRGILGFISRAINDMTETQQKEQQKRKKLERELYQKEKMAALGNVIAGTAHEINTPISIIKTRIQIWERKLKKQNQANGYASLISDESLQMVHDEIDRVSSLIKRLLFFSKPVSNEKTDVDINSLLDESMNWVEDAFSDRHILFHKELYSNLPTILADRDSIKQVLTNVLKNAVEASESNCEIVVESSFLEHENGIQISIRDFGEGVPANVKRNIFDPFFTTKNNGFGLGLSISNEIIKAHNGSIHFEEPSQNGWSSESKNDYTVEDTVTIDVSPLGTVCIIKLPVIS